MLAVKCVSPDGNENIFEASNVFLARKDPLYPESAREFVAHTEDGTVTIDSGTIYVMNRYGKTISHYNFELPPKTHTR